MTEANRSVHDAIRGYLSQCYWTAQRWLELGQNDVLLCEGEEDFARLSSA